MAVTADLLYKGVNLTGIKFEVLEAIHTERVTGEDVLKYACQVVMPDDSVQGDTGWESISDTSPDFTKSPLEDAEGKMVARLTAIGATNIETVE